MWSPHRSVLAAALLCAGCPKNPTEAPAPRATPSPPPGVALVASPPAGCADLPEVRVYLFAWNAQAGLALAAGGKQAIAGSATNSP